jgi:hypothetical protein
LRCFADLVSRDTEKSVENEAGGRQIKWTPITRGQPKADHEVAP